MRREVVSVETPTTFLVATEANMIYALEQSASASHVRAGAGNPGLDRRDLRLQPLPAHGVEHAVSGSGLSTGLCTPEIAWQPYFESLPVMWSHAVCSTDRHNRYHALPAGRGSLVCDRTGLPNPSCAHRRWYDSVA